MTSNGDSEFKIPTFPARGLDVLAEEIVLSAEAAYSRCIDLMNSIEYEEKPICGFFSDLCGDVTVESLKQKFTLEQVAEMNATLQWYHLVLMGHLPKSDGYKDTFFDVKKFLGVSSYTEVLSPSVKLVTSDNPLTFEDLLALITTAPDAQHTPYSQFLKVIREGLDSNTSVNVIAANVELSIDFQVVGSLRDLLYKMDATQRIRWALFISIITHYCDEETFTKELVSEMVGLLPSDISEDMKQQLSRLAGALVKLHEVQNGQNACGMALGGTAAIPIGPTLYAKMDIQGLPNWMPNGGNTCYISATLWGLFLQLHDRVQQKIANTRTEDLLATPAKKVAQEAFKSLYTKISANEVSHISSQEVNDFRRAMQVAFPNRFLSPFTSGQEDAYEFLAATVRDLLGFDCCNESTSKFIVLHTFARINEQPLRRADLYDYEQALAPSYSNQLSYVLDIRLDEHVAASTSFKDLVTTVRQTDVVERNAYLQQENPGLAKYQSIQTLHTEQFLVESKALAPEFFCGRITRFSVDYTTGIQNKRFDHVAPSAFLEFHSKENPAETVPYDLAAICVHSGYSVNAGHYYTYFRKQVGGAYTWFKYDDIHGPEQCQNEQQVLLDVARNGYIYYYKKRPADASIPPEFFIKETVFENPMSQSKEWVTYKLDGRFTIDESKGCHPAFNDKEQEIPSFRKLVSELSQAIYLVDPTGDRDLHILEDGYPIPGDSFRFGEEFASNGIQYIYKQQDGSYLVLSKT